MLTPLDDSPWHQIATTFDHVGTSDVRFFDRLWFAASDRKGASALQFTMGFYQNMNVVDGGFVVIADGRQHNLRVSRQLRPSYDTTCDPLGLEVLEPMQRVRLAIGPNEGGLSGQLVWSATMRPQEERPHHARSWGRVIEDYCRYDQAGEVSGWLLVDGTRIELDRWWACRDHSWGVRERVGIREPVTGQKPAAGASVFAFLFYSTDTHGGHVQMGRRLGASHMTAEVVDLSTGTGVVGDWIRMTASFVDSGRPRRFEKAAFEVRDDQGEVARIDVVAAGPAVAMSGLGYGGYDDGLGLGVYRGIRHVETDVWDVSHPAEVVLPDGTVTRPGHRIQPVRVTQTGPHGTSTGTGSLTLIAETDLEPDGTLQITATA